MLVVQDPEGRQLEPLRPRPSAWVKVGLALAWLAFLASRINDAESVIVTWTATLGALTVAGRRLPRRDTLRRAGQSPSEEPLTGTPSEQANESRTGDGPGPGHGHGSDVKSTGEHPQTPRSHQPSPAIHVAPGPAVRTDRLMADGVPPGALPVAVMTGEEVAAFLRVDLELVVAAIRAGQLPGNELGGEYRVFGRSLQRWLDGGQASG